MAVGDLARVEVFHGTELAKLSPSLAAMDKLSDSHPVDGSQLPAVTAIGDRVGALLQRLVKPKDGSGKIHLVVLDNLMVNAAFIKLPSGNERVVFVNLGAIHHFSTDDEIAYVLAHELEHGTSEIQDYIDVEKKRNPSNPWWLQRAVENENDARAAIERVHEAGLNPYGSVHALESLREKFGDSPSGSHTTTSSRIHTTGLALTAARRHGGMAFKPDEAGAFSHELKQFSQETLFSRPEFIAHQKRRIEQYINSLNPGEIEVAYRSILQNELLSNSPSDSPKWSDNFHREQSDFAALRNSVQKGHTAILEILGKDILPDAELSAYAHAISVRLDNLFSESENRVLGPDYRAPTLGQLSALFHLDGDGANFHNAWYQHSSRPLRAIERLEKQVAVLTAPGYSTNQLIEVFGFYDYLRPEVQAKVAPILLKHLAEQSQTLAQRLGTTTDPAAKESIHKELTRLHGLFAGAVATPVERIMRKALDQNREEGLKEIRGHLAAQLHGSRGIQEFSAALHTTYYWMNGAKTHEESPLAVSLALGLTLRPDFATEVFNEAFQRDYLIELNAAMERTLKKGNWTGADAFAYEDQLAWFATRGYLQEPALRAAGVLSGIERNFLGISQKFKERFAKVPLETAERERLIRSLTAAHFPFLARTLGMDTPKGREQMRRDLMRARPWLKDGELNFARVRQMLFPEGMTEKAAGFFHELGPSVALNFQPGDHKPVHLSAEDYLRDALAYDDWLKVHHPDKFRDRLLVLWQGAQGELRDSQHASFQKGFDRNHISEAEKEYIERVKTFRDERFRHHLKIRESLPVQRRFGEALMAVQGEIDPIRDDDVLHKEVAEQTKDWLPLDLVSRIEAAMGFQDANRIRSAIHNKSVEARARAATDAYRRERILRTQKTAYLRSDYFIEELKNTDADRIPLETLTELFFRMTEQLGTPESDRFFHSIWKRSENRPEIRARFRPEAVVKRLHYDDAAKILATWQLDQRFGLDKTKKLTRREGFEFPRNGTLRNDLHRVRDSIEAMTTEGSQLRNDLLIKVEEAYITNEKETAFLDEKRSHVGNWQENARLAAVDLPSVLFRKAKSDEEKLGILKYLIGASDALPELSSIREENDKKAFRIGAPYARQHFRQAAPLVRAFVLQPILDEKTGISNKEEIRRLVLGDHGREPVLVALFDSYLESIAPSEQRALLGYVLGSYNADKRGTPPLKAILEAMGPFGIKTGQFLRTTGIVGPELRAELDDFFDRTNPPDRAEIFVRAKEILGSNYKHFKIRHLIGAASINWAVLADYRNPETGEVTPVILRSLRKAVEGQITNEDGVWQKSLLKLSTHPDLGVRRLARVLEEARGHTMVALSPGGSELDHRAEWAHYEKTKAAYQMPADAETGFRVDVLNPEHGLLGLIDPRFQYSSSILPFVDNIRLKDVADPKLRAALAGQIFRSELRALLDKGAFDPDGHPGNWLVDVKNRRLVRIDYAQFREYSGTDAARVKNLLRLLLLPRLGARESEELADLLPKVLTIEGYAPNLKVQVAKIVGASEFPAFHSPAERLYHLRERLEAQFHAEGQTDVHLGFSDVLRSQLGSLSRIAVYREMTEDADEVERFERSGPLEKFVSFNRFLNRQRYLKILSEAVGIPYGEMKVHIAVGEGTRRVTELCRRVFERIMRKEMRPVNR